MDKAWHSLATDHHPPSFTNPNHQRSCFKLVWTCLVSIFNCEHSNNFRKLIYFNPTSNEANCNPLKGICQLLLRLKDFKFSSKISKNCFCWRIAHFLVTRHSVLENFWLHTEQNTIPIPARISLKDQIAAETIVLCQFDLEYKKSKKI